MAREAEPLPLSLFVPRVRGTDHVDPSLAAHDLATFTDPLDTRSNLHRNLT